MGSLNTLYFRLPDPWYDDMYQHQRNFLLETSQFGIWYISYHGSSRILRKSPKSIVLIVVSCAYMQVLTNPIQQVRWCSSYNMCLYQVNQRTLGLTPWWGTMSRLLLILVGTRKGQAGTYLCGWDWYVLI